jgi:hypothetical protein
MLFCDYRSKLVFKPGVTHTKVETGDVVTVVVADEPFVDKTGH